MHSIMRSITSSTSFAFTRSVALAAGVACADSPLAPRIASHSLSAPRDSVTLIQHGDVYQLVVQHPCSNGRASALDAFRGFGDSTTALLMNIDRGPKCGCAETIPPPARLKGYICTLTTWDCGDWGSSCNYQCSKPVIVYV